MIDMTSAPTLGVAVDLDLREIGDEATRTHLRALYAEHHLLRFKDQSLTIEQQIAVMELFGEVLKQRKDAVGFITNEAVKENFLGASELAFHSDLAFSPKPYHGISLHAVQVDNGRTSTRYIDSADAYDRLPAALKEEVEGLEALHVFGANLAGRNLSDTPDHLPRQVHPLVWRHPKTGRKILYVSYNQTASIVGYDKARSDDLIERLFEYSYPPHAIYDHRWYIGDVVIWDNIAMQHARGDISEVGVRRLQRAVIGEAGFFEQYPEFE